FNRLCFLATVATALLPLSVCAQMNPARTAVDSMRNIDAFKKGISTAEGLNATGTANANGANAPSSATGSATPAFTFGHFRFSLPPNCHVVESTVKSFQASCKGGAAASAVESFFINQSPLD